jgi:hypothetical protein
MSSVCFEELLLLAMQKTIHFGLEIHRKVVQLAHEQVYFGLCDLLSSLFKLCVGALHIIEGLSWTEAGHRLIFINRLYILPPFLPAASISIHFELITILRQGT